MPSFSPAPQTKFTAYVSEPITQCSPRESSRIRTLVGFMKNALAKPPYEIKLYLPSEVTAPSKRATMRPEHVYLLDRIRVVEADFMLVIADQTSFGIGGEVELASSLGKPVIIISRAAKLSRFLTGTPTNVTRTRGGGDFIAYSAWRDLRPQLFQILDEVLQHISSADESLVFRDVGRKVRQLRKARGLSLEALAQNTGLRIEQLRLLEKPFDQIKRELAEYERNGDLDLVSINLTPHQLEQLTNIGLAALDRLAKALGVGIGVLIGEAASSPRGPGEEIRTRLEQARRAREQSLRARALQYDVSFREFERLYGSLVESYGEQTTATRSGLPKGPHTITEREFQDAIKLIRNNPTQLGSASGRGLR